MKRLLLCVLCALVILVNTTSASAAAIYKVDRKDLSVNKELAKEVQNILMLLQDSSADASSKTMLVASINKQTGRAAMISIVPQVLVNMPMAGEQPLCDAYMLGEVNLAMKSINEVFGLNVQHFAVIDVSSFGKIVDDLGGLNMTLTAQEAAALGLAEGKQTLSGDQTMAYMRLESDDPSVSRPYACIMQMLYQATRDKDVGKLMSLGTNLLGALKETNLGVFDLIGLATPVMGSSAERVELSVPAADALTKTEWNGRSVYTADMEQAKTLVHEAIY